MLYVIWISTEFTFYFTNPWSLSPTSVLLSTFAIASPKANFSIYQFVNWYLKRFTCCFTFVAIPYIQHALVFAINESCRPQHVACWSWNWSIFAFYLIQHLLNYSYIIYIYIDDKYVIIIMPCSVVMGDAVVCAAVVGGLLTSVMNRKK